MYQPIDRKTECDDRDIDDLLGKDFQLDLPLRSVNLSEILTTINSFANKKAPDFYLIDKIVLKELPHKAIKYLKILFNSIL